MKLSRRFQIAPSPDVINQLKLEDGIIDAAFVWMTEARDLANANYGDQKGGIFIGNGFHRMVSIGLKAKQDEVKESVQPC